MSARVEGRIDSPGSALRWVVCFGLVLGLHIGAALLLLRRVLPLDVAPAGAPPADAVMLDLPPAAAVTPSNPAPPAPQPPLEPQPSPEPQPPPEPQPSAPTPATAPQPPVPQPPVPVPEAIPVPPPQASTPAIPEPPPPAPPPPRPIERTHEHRPQPARPLPPRRHGPREETAREPTPDQAAAAPSAPKSAPVPALATPSDSTIASWRSALIERLQQAKRYPEAARAFDVQGVATVRFTMDRSGHVLSVNLVHSSGSETLDQEAVAMFRRAEPLPALPDGMGTDTLTLTVPVSFSLK